MTTAPSAIARKRILITGMSGTGKSSVIDRLAELGYIAIDADAPGYSAEVPAPEDELTGVGPGRDWVWQEGAIRALLDVPTPLSSLPAAPRTRVPSTPPSRTSSCSRPRQRSSPSA